MSETVTHTRGSDSPLNLITGEPPGIKEILERRAAEGPLADEPPLRADPPPAPKDDAETAAAKEIAALRVRATEADARAAESDRARVNAEQARQVALQGAEETGFTAVTTALVAVAAEKTGLIAELRAAGEASDYARIGEINVRLGEIGAEMRDLERGKTQFEHDRQNRLSAPPRVDAAPVAGSATERSILAGLRAPSREAFLASRTPETREFLNQHPEFFNDPAAHQRMIGAESLARGRGHTIDSQQYFDTIREAALGESTSQTPPRREPAERADRSITPGASPSREGTSPTGRRVAAGDVYVSQEDKVAATWMGVDPVEYAQEKEALRARGEYPYRRR